MHEGTAVHVRKRVGDSGPVIVMRNSCSVYHRSCGTEGAFRYA